MPAIKTGTTQFVSVPTFPDCLGDQAMQCCRPMGISARVQGCITMHEMARQVYGRMVDGCRAKSLIYESLKAGEL